MFEFIGKHKWLWIALSILLLVVVPVIIWLVYYRIGQPISSGDMLSYYGAVLSFIGTVFLGLLALYQNDIIQKNADEREELLKNQEIERNQPRFSISKKGSDSALTSIECEIINISENHASNITIKRATVETIDTEEIIKEIEINFSTNIIPPACSECFTLRLGEPFIKGQIIKCIIDCEDKYGTKRQHIVKGYFNSNDVIFTVHKI